MSESRSVGTRRGKWQLWQVKCDLVEGLYRVSSDRVGVHCEAFGRAMAEQKGPATCGDGASYVPLQGTRAASRMSVLRRTVADVLIHDAGCT